MKKTLGKVLSILIVMSILMSTIAFVSFATDTYEQIQVGTVGTVTLTEENPSKIVKFTPTESGVYFISSYNCDEYDPYVYVLNSEFEEIASDDDGGTGVNFYCLFNAEAGNIYYIQMTTYGGAAAEYNYKFKAIEVAGDIELDVVETVTLTEDYSSVFVEFTPVETGVHVISSDYSDYSYCDPRVYIYDSEFEEIASDDDGSDGRNFKCRFNAEAGNKYYIQLTTAGGNETAKYDYVINLFEPPVSIEGVAKVDLIENYNGHYTTDSIYDEDEYIGESDEYFYYTIDNDFVEFTLTFEDGTTYTGSYWEVENLLGADFDYDSNQSYETPFKVGYNSITYYILDFEIDVSIKVVENPVADIVMNNITIIENGDGYWRVLEYWDSELEEWVEDSRYFYYTYTPSYTVVMKDGTTCKSDYNGCIEYMGNMYWMGCYDDQDYETPWGLGEHEVTGNILGHDVSYKVTVVETPIKNVTLTPVRAPIFGIDEEYGYIEYLDFVADIKFKDGSTDKCLVSKLYEKYGYSLNFEETEFVSDYVSKGAFSFMGYDGEFEVTFIDNPYKSITISGTYEIEITFNRFDGSTETAEALDFDSRYGDEGFDGGYIKTEIGTFPGGIYCLYDDGSHVGEKIRVGIGDMVSNTLELNWWYCALLNLKSTYYKLSMYQLHCDEYYNREFVGLDIANLNFDVTDLGNLAEMHCYCELLRSEYEVVNGRRLWYNVFRAEDIEEIIYVTFGFEYDSNSFDITEHAGYHSEDDTVWIPEWGFGDLAYNYYYDIEFVNEKYYGTVEYYDYTTGNTQHIQIIFDNDASTIEKIQLSTKNLNGWVQENGKWAYYENGIKVVNKWIKDSAGWCYLGSDGYCVTNKWVKDSKGWCYLDANGRMVYNNWVYDGGKWYYMDANGYMVSNTWKKDSKGWCYLGSSGAMLTNSWVKDSAGWCYVGANGYCVTNTWMKDSVGWCYLDANGRMATNKWIKDSKGWCYVGANGYCLTNSWVKDSKGWCYLDANGRMVYSNWVKDGGKWYYLDANGYMVTGTKVIGGKTYKFASNGVLIG